MGIENRVAVRIEVLTGEQMETVKNRQRRPLPEVCSSLLAIPIVLCLLCTTQHSYSAEGGYSNYVPAFYGDFALGAAPEEGLSLRNDVYFYRADDDFAVRSGEVIADIDIELTFNYFTLVHNPGLEVFGAEYVFGATLVAGKVDIEAGLSSGSDGLRVSDDKTSYGDITFVPAAFYWNDGGMFNYSWSFYVVAPVGDWDEDDLANTGLNFWTYETDVAINYLDETTGQDYSVVIGYGYNTENKDTDYKSGDEVHIDFNVNQFLSESWAVGINGFFYRQLSGDSGDGALLGDFKGEASGIGPQVMWMPPKYEGNVAFVAKWVHEYNSENRMDGDHVFLSFMMKL